MQKLLLIIDTLTGELPYRKERRLPLGRALGWVAAFACWLPLIYLWIRWA